MHQALTETRCKLCSRPVSVEEFFLHRRLVHQVTPDEQTVADVPVALANPLEFSESIDQSEYYATCGH